MDAVASAGLIGRAHRDQLDRLPLTVTLDIDGLGPTLFCHASPPRREDEMLLVDSPPGRWADALNGVDAAVVVCGHTHMRFRPAGGRTPGRQSRQRRHALWAPGRRLGAARPRRDAAPHQLRRRGGGQGHWRQPVSRRADWAAEYVLNHYSDTEALEAFTVIARQQA